MPERNGMPESIKIEVGKIHKSPPVQSENKEPNTLFCGLEKLYQ